MDGRARCHIAHGVGIEGHDRSQRSLFIFRHAVWTRAGPGESLLLRGSPSNVALLALRPAAVDQSPRTVNRGSIG